MSFTISDQVNPPTVFIATRSELTDRFDPEMVLFRRQTHNFKYPVRKLKTFYAESSQYGAGERGLERTANDQPRYVRITDIDEDGILSDEMGATAETVDPRYILEENDLLLARSGNTVGKSYLHKVKNSKAVCFYAGYLIRFRFSEDEINPEYVFALTQLPYYRSWVRAIQRPAGQPNINAEEYASLEIPYPPRPVQDKAVLRLNDAYELKRQQDEQANALLAGIDDVLLDALGITPPPAPPNTLESRVFKRSFGEMTGDRWDPLFHQADVFAFVRGANCEYSALASHIRYIRTGFPAGRGDQTLDQENGIIQIRPTNLTNDRELTFQRNVYISRDELPKRKSDLLGRGEVLFNNTNSQDQVGKTVWFDLDGEFFSSNHITRIATQEQTIDPQYLSFLLNLYQRHGDFYKLCTNWNNQSGVGPDVLRGIPIPIPSVKNQREIVNQIEITRDQARNLRTQARLDLDQAKRDIEALILSQGNQP